MKTATSNSLPGGTAFISNANHRDPCFHYIIMEISTEIVSGIIESSDKILTLVCLQPDSMDMRHLY